MKKNKALREIAEEWANKIFEEAPGSDEIDKEFQRKFLDYVVFGQVEYPMPFTEKENQLILEEYNKNNPDQYTNIEYLSREEIIKRYGHNLTEKQLKELDSYGKE